MKRFLFALFLTILSLNQISALSNYRGVNLSTVCDGYYWSDGENCYDLIEDEEGILEEDFKIVCPYFFQIEDYICIHTYAAADDGDYRFFNCYHQSNNFSSAYTYFGDKGDKFSSAFELLVPGRDRLAVYDVGNDYEAGSVFNFVTVKAADEGLNEYEYNNFSGCPVLNYDLEKIGPEHINGSSGRSYKYYEYKISIAYNAKHLDRQINPVPIEGGIGNMVCLNENCPQLDISGNDHKFFNGYVSKPNLDNNNNGSTPVRPNQSGGFISCSDIDVDKIKACGCIPAGVADITSKIYFILRIVGPVLLLILGGFDMAKAVASQDESSIEKAKKKLINKFIAAAAIFFVLTIMEFVVGILAKNAGDILECIHILLDGYVI